MGKAPWLPTSFRLQPCLVLGLLGSGAAAAAMTPLTVRAPSQAGRAQEGLLAWVETPVPGATCRWEIQGGEFQSSPDQDWVLFRAGTGDLVKLTCLATGKGQVVGMGYNALLVKESPQIPEGAFGLQLPDVGIKGRNLAAQVADPDDSRYLYRWIVDGKMLDITGSKASLPAGARDRMRVTCQSTDRKSGAREMVQQEVDLAAPLEPPRVILPERIYEGRPVTARVADKPGDASCAYRWEHKPEVGPELQAQDLDEFTFTAPAGGTRFQLTCTVRNNLTQEERSWTAALQTLARPRLVPVRIESFRLDPDGPIRRDQRSCTLRWDLDGEPDALHLRDEGTGSELLTLEPAQRHCTLPGPFQGRRKISLVASRKDLETKETVSDARTLDIEVPGISVLAGDVAHVGSAYMREATEGSRPWGLVTGLAWKAPWLYIAEREHHTVRRVRACAGGFEVEEVAGMRGLPGTGRPGEDRLSRPGQLVHRRYTAASGEPVEEWLVLQPEARCIQAFRESQVQESMRVLVGAFTGPSTVRARPSSNQESKGEQAQEASCLKAPVAMAAHPGTGHVLVVDHGHRAILMFAPEGDQCHTLVKGVEAGGVAANRRGDVFYSDPVRHVVRVLRCLDSGTAEKPAFAPPEVFAGEDGQSGAVDGDRKGKARFLEPRDLTLDASDQEYLLISETGNHLVRRVPADPTRREDVETIGGNIDQVAAERELLPVSPIGVDAVVDRATGEIRLFTQATGSVHTVPGSTDFKAGGAVLDTNGNLFFSDPGRHVVMVRRLLGGSPGQKPDYAAPEVFAGTPGLSGRREGPRLAPAAAATAASGAPDTASGTSGEEHPEPKDVEKKTERKSGARFAEPGELALDPKDNQFLLVTDPMNQTIWRVGLDLGLNGEVKDFRKASDLKFKAGTGGHADGPRVTARFDGPRHLAGDGSGRVFLLDQTGPSRLPVIRRIDLDGRVSTLGGSGVDASRRSFGENGLDAPGGIGVDRAGHIYVADGYNRCIRRITPDGKMAVAAGSRRDPEFTPDDDQAPLTSAFHNLGFLGVDALGRVVAAEPERPRLRLVDFATGQAKGGVATLRDRLDNRHLGIFPALAPAVRSYVYVAAKPSTEDDSHVLTVFRNPDTAGQVVDPKVPVQALCCDRANRICAVLQPDLEQPGAIRINRYRFLASGAIPVVETKRNAETKGDSKALAMPVTGGAPQWVKESVTLVPAASVDTARIDGRPYAPCGYPRITALAADSHGGLYLADAGNGMIWHVPENLGGIRRVAGRYPYLGPVGEGFDDPLPGMQGLAVTPDDDLVVTCGNAVLQVTLEKRRAPAAWQVAATEPWSNAPKRKPKEPKTILKVRRLQSDQLENTWRLAMGSSQKALDRARMFLNAAQCKQKVTEARSTERPQSQEFKATLENMVPVLAEAEQEWAFRTAESAARAAAYKYLLMVAGHKDNPPPDGPPEDQDAVLADSKAKQARYEFLALARGSGKEKTPEMHPEADRLRLAYLEAVEAAAKAEVERAEASRILKAARRGPRGDTRFIEADLARAEKDLKRLQADLGKALAAVRAFNKKRGEEAIPEFQSWTAQGEGKQSTASA